MIIFAWVIPGAVIDGSRWTSCTNQRTAVIANSILCLEGAANPVDYVYVPMKPASPLETKSLLAR